MAIDPNQMEAFAGPKPGEEVLDELDENELAGEPIVDQERLDNLVSVLLENADYFEECCDELDQAQLSNTSEDLDEANSEILSDAVMDMPDDEVFDDLVGLLGDFSEEERDALSVRLEEEGADDRFANLVAHISRLVDNGTLARGEDEEDEEDEDEEDEDLEEEDDEDALDDDLDDLDALED